MILPIVEDRDLKIADLQEDLNRLKQRIDTCGNSIVALQSKLTELTELIVHHQPSNQADKIQKQEAKLSKTIDSLEGMIAMFRSKQEKLKDIAEISLSAVYTPRAIARVFHGLHSPAFPSSTWKRSPYWGELQHIDFEEIKSIAECVLYEVSIPNHSCFHSSIIHYTNNANFTLFSSSNRFYKSISLFRPEKKRRKKIFKKKWIEFLPNPKTSH